ncbi:acetylornithine carbamoyltransferase [Balneolaceae bacterium YR4-1]|uniref:N-succinylornithine carbamoyltransferase n=1 Tax=Halalkalibaculum roseum TaxID=2709311 RepID=A0A6M1T0Q2_9BACT|nr:acetylornithine carbamoyltransferase [Halalkalibaculum roseum]NGP77084.1 acetylornithine carbamoyltransferase [Halalkalibaculum roseum]
MKHFTSANDSADPLVLARQTIALKNQKQNFEHLGRSKTLGLVFFNPSLRTRMSTTKAAYDLGLNVLVLNVNGDAWNIEFEDGTVMDGSSQEHVKDAIKVMTGYCDIIGVRTFAELKNREDDYTEPVLNAFLEYSEVPVISLESATLHPLQSLADITTILETDISNPKIAVSWAPHPKALPQAVTNSFLQWIKFIEAEVVVAHPKGYELHEEFTGGFELTNDQSYALDSADFVYVKNWSSYSKYGQRPPVSQNWTITSEKMAATNSGSFMHCLPIRRNVVAEDQVIDNSLIYKQAKNRETAAKTVLKNILEDINE